MTINSIHVTLFASYNRLKKIVKIWFSSEVKYFPMAISPELEHPRKAFGLAARDSSGVLSPFNFSRR
jgi:hypothetical protein